MDAEDIITIGELVAIGAVIAGGFIFFPQIINGIIVSETEYQPTQLSQITYSFNDTVVMVRYNYGWFGILSSTTVTLQHGFTVPLQQVNLDNASEYDLVNQTLTQFSFSSNWSVQEGKLYSVSFNVTTWSDNTTNVQPVSIALVDGD
jgi:hypothetical protein